jgi:hypothetical protein
MPGEEPDILREDRAASYGADISCCEQGAVEDHVYTIVAEIIAVALIPATIKFWICV